MLEPFLLERELLPKVWGGRALQDIVGIELPADGQPIGESWELFDRPEGSSRVRGADVSLAELVRRHPDEVVGRGVKLGHGGAFPLTLKFLDAREACSLQVHPSDEQANDDLGKDECCLILDSTEDARFVHGFRPGVVREEFLERWTTPDVRSMLYSFRPERGQLIHVPPGLPHAMGPGVVAFEVQQNSDQTYRIYDWGRDRETTPDAARDVVQMTFNEAPPAHPPTPLEDGGELLLATKNYAVRRYRTSSRLELATGGRFLTVTCLAGVGRLRWSGGGELGFRQADTALVPASTASVGVEPGGPIDLVVCTPGDC